jgi:riboflavin kinase/FMN adenylyltransferase
VQVFFDYNKIPPSGGTVVTLGNFDGFHLGHQRIVGRTVEIAKSSGLRSVVITFHPHPRQLFSSDLAVLTPLERKVELLGESGVDVVLVQPFTRAFASMDPRLFLSDVLQEALDCRHVVVGYDYAFGKGGSGSTQLLELETARLGMKSEVIKPIKINNDIISSTAVRKFLSLGKVETAAEFMGRRFQIRGRVEHGAGRGKMLGFPTANIYPSQSAALPAFGVYMVEVSIKGKGYWGVANIGRHPTFPDDRISLEVMVLDFESDIYGTIIDVMFHKRLRDERRFPDADSLSNQVGLDVAEVKALLQNPCVLKLQRV